MHSLYQTTHIVQALLKRVPLSPRVDLVTTDGYLFPNRILQERDIMNRKGFPKSYDIRALLGFLYQVKSGWARVTAPVYSHLVYDIDPDKQIQVECPDILILEGLNVLQSGCVRVVRGKSPLFVSDFFDFSIYVDAPEDFVKRWHMERFQQLRMTAFSKVESYFHRYASLTEAEKGAEGIWNQINGVNLRENILLTRERAHLILHKGFDYDVQKVHLRKL